METTDVTTPCETLRFNLGTFEGFNFRHCAPIDRILTGEEVASWDHDVNGEAQFWPSGDHPGVQCVFGHCSTVSACELLALDALLQELGDDSILNFLMIGHAVNMLGFELTKLDGEQVEDLPLHVFTGTSFLDLRRQAAFELFELYYPEEYRVWEKSLCGGLIFDEDRFLDSPIWTVEEVQLGDKKALVVSSD